MLLNLNLLLQEQACSLHNTVPNLLGSDLSSSMVENTPNSRNPNWQPPHHHTSDSSFVSIIVELSAPTISYYFELCNFPVSLSCLFFCYLGLCYNSERGFDKGKAYLVKLLNNTSLPLSIKYYFHNKINFNLLTWILNLALNLILPNTQTHTQTEKTNEIPQTTLPLVHGRPTPCPQAKSGPLDFESGPLKKNK